MSEVRSGKRRLAGSAKTVAVILALGVVCGAGVWGTFTRNTGKKPLLEGEGMDPANPSTMLYTFPPRFTDELGTAEHPFAVRNVSDRLIRITDLKTSCSCAGASMSDRDLKPGQQASLVMKVNQQGRTETFGAECLVVPDAGEPLRCRLVSPIFRRVEFNPPSVHLGVVRPGAEIERVVTLVTRSRGSPPLDNSRRLSVVGPADQKAVGEAVLNQEESKIEDLPGGIVAQLSPVRIRLTLPNTAGQGRWDVVPGKTAADAGVGETRLRIDWFVESPYEVTPSRLFFGSVHASKEPPGCTVTIRRRDGAEFRLVDLQCRSPEVTLSCSTRGTLKERHDLTVEVKREGWSGFVYDQVVVGIDDPTIPRLTIPVAASK